ncbi:hypothetical protein [Solidesulfovibrio carbinolicus]|uniref:DUF4168 domain-containing protein n=1 Tax=Solidesulfovibrio carbinolicus TaxID=296842 RepID=A0A4P6HJ75_9BACT|nr:hypothetical protein [Solidesulfovibrio carbinolicus]QAZ66636.1 hypothetical protein C3Y92_05015 [Solidesulfovibrio carbinolicus]
MNAVRAAVILTVLALAAALPAHAASKDDVVKFYQGYLELVSASNFVTLSRDTPEAYDAKFDEVAKSAGFENSADALAVAEAYAADSQVAALKQSVADMILQQYRPYRE